MFGNIDKDYDAHTEIKRELENEFDEDRFDKLEAELEGELAADDE